MRIGLLETIFDSMSASAVGKIFASAVVCGLIPLLVASKLPEDTPLLAVCAGGAAAGFVIAIFLTWPRAVSGIACVGVAISFVASFFLVSQDLASELTPAQRFVPVVIGAVAGLAGIALMTWAYRRAKSNR